jgi:hypothetical protein
MRNSLFFVAALSLFLAALEAAQSENGLSSDGRRDETIDVSLEGRDGMDNSNIRVDDQRLHVENRRCVPRQLILNFYYCVTSIISGRCN